MLVRNFMVIPSGLLLLILQCKKQLQWDIKTMSFLLTEVSVQPVSAVVFVGEIVKVLNTQNYKITIMSINKHIEECATECEVDLEVSNSNEENIEYKGHIIEVWYDENSNSPLAWNAFVKGFGTYSEYGRDRVLHVAKRKIDGLV